MMSILALRAEHLAPFVTSVRMMAAVETEKASVGGLQLFNAFFYVDHSFSLEPSDYYFHKIHRMDLLTFGSFER